MRRLNVSAKVRRYSASGSTHSSGTGATSSNNLLVMESNSIELQAASPSHNNLSRSIGADAVSFSLDCARGTGAASARANQAAAAQSKTKTAKSADHSVAWRCAAM